MTHMTHSLYVGLERWDVSTEVPYWARRALVREMRHVRHRLAGQECRGTHRPPEPLISGSNRGVLK
jgi:hypothetical protein